MTDSPRPHLAVVTSVHGSGACLPDLCARLRTSLDALSERWIVLLVDDGDPLDGWARIVEQTADPRFRGLRLSANRGESVALAAGLDQADADWVVVMDSDGQDPPEAIGRLYAEALEQGLDVVVARRPAREQSGLRRLVTPAFYGARRLMGAPPLDPRVGVFRIVSAPVVQAARRCRERHRMFAELMGSLGFRAGSVDVEHAARSEGGSSYSLGDLVALALRTVAAAGDAPFRGAALGAPVLVGLGCVGVLLGGGWMAGLFALGGAALGMLGLLGMLAGQILDEVRARPLYVIAEDTAGRAVAAEAAHDAGGGD